MTDLGMAKIGDTPTIGAGFWAEEWNEPPSERMTRQPQYLSQHTSTSLDSFADGLRNILGDCIPTTSGYRSLPLNQEPKLMKVSTMNNVRAVAMSGMSRHSIRDELDRAVSQDLEMDYMSQVQAHSVILFTLPKQRTISEQVVASSVLTWRRYRQWRFLSPSFRRSHRRRDCPLLPKPQPRVGRQSDCGFGWRAATVGWRPLGKDWRR